VSLRFDLSGTQMFGVLVGKEKKRFQLYSSVMVQRSEFFRAARSAQWLKDPTKPVDLEDYDADIFEAYLNCAYFGARTIKAKVEDEAPPEGSLYRYDHAHRNPWLAQRQYGYGWGEDVHGNIDESESVEPEKPKLPEEAFTWSQKECERHCTEGHDEQTPYDHACSDHLLYLAKIWVQADRLQDVVTANSIIDELTRFSYCKGYNPDDEVINLVYESTVHGSPLRKLMRDLYLYSTRSSYYLIPHLATLPAELYRDIYVEFLRVKENDPASTYFQHGLGSACFDSVRDKLMEDRCRYHLHNSRFPLEACGDPRYEMKFSEEEDN
jgi:hypothetical protein